MLRLAGGAWAALAGARGGRCCALPDSGLAAWFSPWSLLLLLLWADGWGSWDEAAPRGRSPGTVPSSSDDNTRPTSTDSHWCQLQQSQKASLKCMSESSLV